MKENLMNPAHKATNDRYRGNYDRIFGRRGLEDHKSDPKCCENGKNDHSNDMVFPKVSDLNQEFSSVTLIRIGEPVK